MPEPKSAGGAWAVLQQHGKQLFQILSAWDAAAGERKCSLADFTRAAQALGALGLIGRTPDAVELGSMYEHMCMKGASLPLDALLKPLEPRTFEVFEDDMVDPDDCFDCFTTRCMSCGKEAEKLLVCQRCKKARYCSRPCQLQGWRRGHKETCGCPRPTPGKIARGTPQVAIAALREFGCAHGGLAHTAMSKLAAFALDPEHSEKNLRAMIDWPGGIEAIVNAMKAYPARSELTLPGYMLLCAVCSTAKEGAVACVQAEGLDCIIDLFKVSVNDDHLLKSGLTAMRNMAATGPTAQQQLIDKEGVFGIVWAMREQQDNVPLLVEAICALSNIAHRGGVDVRKYVIYNSGVEGVVTSMRKHVDTTLKNERLAAASCLALRNFIAGDDSNIICGSAAEVAHLMTETMAKYLGIEAVVDAMMYHQANESIQEHGSAVLANVGSVDLGAKRQHDVIHNTTAADTQATRNIIDSLVPIVKAIKRFPRLGSPRHALHVIVANLGSPREALEAGADPSWLPLGLQFDKDEGDKL